MGGATAGWVVVVEVVIITMKVTLMLVVMVMSMTMVVIISYDDYNTSDCCGNVGGGCDNDDYSI